MGPLCNSISNGDGFTELALEVPDLVGETLNQTDELELNRLTICLGGGRTFGSVNVGVGDSLSMATLATCPDTDWPVMR